MDLLMLKHVFIWLKVWRCIKPAHGHFKKTSQFLHYMMLAHMGWLDIFLLWNPTSSIYSHHSLYIKYYSPPTPWMHWLWLKIIYIYYNKKQWWSKCPWLFDYGLLCFWCSSYRTNIIILLLRSITPRRSEIPHSYSEKSYAASTWVLRHKPG